MNIEKATSLALKSKWKTEPCHQGQACWCSLVSLETPIEYKVDSKHTGKLDCLITEGIVHKTVAEHIVRLHNNSITA